MAEKKEANAGKTKTGATKSGKTNSSSGSNKGFTMILKKTTITLQNDKGVKRTITETTSAPRKTAPKTQKPINKPDTAKKAAPKKK